MLTDHGASPPCAELPADVLGEIAGLLHDAGDLVRFRAVCRPWREAAPPSRKPTSFLPWLVESWPSPDAPGVLVHSPLSTRKPRHLLMPLSALRGMEIAGSDTFSGRVLAVGHSDEGRHTVALINPLGGDAVSLPLLPRSKSSLHNKWESASVVVCRNGAVVFYTNVGDDLAAIRLRPGEETGCWEEVDVTCPVGVGTRWLCPDKRRATALWSSVVSPGVACGVVTQPMMTRVCQRNLLEFRGDLLFVDMHMPERFTPGSTTPNPMSVQVHKMQAQDSGWHRWVETERTETDHLCFFLGSKSSLAIDAREYAGSVTGGCVYFTFWPMKWTEMSEVVCGVYRYCFRSGTATVVDELPTGILIPMWFMPRPSVSLSTSLPRVQ